MFVSKLISNFTTPLGLGFLLFIIVGVLYKYGKLSWARNVFIISLLQLWFFSTPYFSEIAGTRLEQMFLPKPVAEYPEVGYAIILGGAVDGAYKPRVYSDLGDASDRLMLGFRLYQAGKVKKLILSGGFIDFLGSSVSEASLMKEILLTWGVADSDMLLDEASRNTYENAIRSGEIVREYSQPELLLITSAMHMRRANAVFKAQGISVIPAPTDYNVVESDPDFIFTILPNAENLNLSTSILKEFIGYIYYWLRGWV